MKPLAIHDDYKLGSLLRWYDITVVSWSHWYPDFPGHCLLVSVIWSAQRWARREHWVPTWNIRRGHFVTTLTAFHSKHLRLGCILPFYNNRGPLGRLPVTHVHCLFGGRLICDELLKIIYKHTYSQWRSLINVLRPEQDGRHFCRRHFHLHFLEWKHLNFK